MILEVEPAAKKAKLDLEVALAIKTAQSFAARNIFWSRSKARGLGASQRSRRDAAAVITAADKKRVSTPSINGVGGQRRSVEVGS
eukprot:6181341-Amphidinium_carterae.1